MLSKNINIELTQDEALVLFDFLSRFSEKGKLNIVHQSEERVLWNLTCSLEKILVEPLQKDYEVLLNIAREKLKDSNK